VTSHVSRPRECGTLPSASGREECTTNDADPMHDEEHNVLSGALEEVRDTINLEDNFFLEALVAHDPQSSTDYLENHPAPSAEPYSHMATLEKTQGQFVRQERIFDTNSAAENPWSALIAGAPWNRSSGEEEEESGALVSGMLNGGFGNPSRFGTFGDPASSSLGSYLMDPSAALEMPPGPEGNLRSAEVSENQTPYDWSAPLTATSQSTNSVLGPFSTFSTIEGHVSEASNEHRSQDDSRSPGSMIA
jgi:hypothetical protein